MKLDQGMDSGPLLSQVTVQILDRETAPDLTRRLFGLGAELLIETLPRWASGNVQETPQDETFATFTTLVKKQHGQIDWNDDAERIARMMRAYTPWPGAFTHWKGKLLKILEADAKNGSEPLGFVVRSNDGKIDIGTGDGLLAVSALQLEGRSPANSQDFARGYPDFLGSTLRTP